MDNTRPPASTSQPLTRRRTLNCKEYSAMLFQADEHKILSEANMATHERERVEKIAGWPSYHDTLHRVLGFPDS
jgi:hypothetical protein